MIDYQRCFINNIKFYRKKKGISQAMLAEACNVSNGTIGNIECGITKPSFDLIVQIADCLGIKPESLFYTDEKPSFQNEIPTSDFTPDQIRKIKEAFKNAEDIALSSLKQS